MGFFASVEICQLISIVYSVGSLTSWGFFQFCQLIGSSFVLAFDLLKWVYWVNYFVKIL